MKGIVMELADKTAIVLMSDGSFKKVKNKNYKIGQRIENENFKRMIMLKFKKLSYMTAALVLALVLSSGGFAYAYFTPYSYVSIDINPSVQLEVNRFDRVINVEEVNNDAQILLKDLFLTNTDINEAINLIISEAEDEGYLSSTNTNDVMITAACGNTEKANEMIQSILTEVNKDDAKTFDVKAESTTLESVKDAKTLGVSFGKFTLIQNHIEKSGQSKVDITTLAEKPIKEIMNIIEKIDDEYDMEQDGDDEDANAKVDVKDDDEDVDDEYDMEDDEDADDEYDVEEDQEDEDADDEYDMEDDEDDEDADNEYDVEEDEEDEDVDDKDDVKDNEEDRDVDDKDDIEEDEEDVDDKDDVEDNEDNEDVDDKDDVKDNEDDEDVDDKDDVEDNEDDEDVDDKDDVEDNEDDEDVDDKDDVKDNEDDEEVDDKDTDDKVDVEKDDEDVD